MKPASLFPSYSCRGWLLTALLLGACGQQAGQAVAPVEITAGTTCSLDGMTLADYPGPKAQIHYADQPAPEYFCDLVELFNVIHKPEQSRKVAAIYVQDMGKADWEQPQGHWVDARSAYFVAGSSRMGSMGPTLGAFAEQQAASQFAATYGGKVLKFDQVTADMVALDGGALHDQNM